MSHADLKEIVRRILERPLGLNWSLQGFGMLRLYLTPHIRLHIWSKRYVVPNVSLIHDHPWNFRSTIIVGRIVNTRFIETTGQGEEYWQQRLLCGEGGGLCEGPTKMFLHPYDAEILEEGETYEQEANEIHKSSFQDGTVTLIERDFMNDPHHARVFWPVGEQWVSAEPRKPTDTELFDICRSSLRLHFGG